VRSPRTIRHQDKPDCRSRRSRFLAAKALVIAALTITVSEITAFVAFFIGQALISGHAPTAALDRANVGATTIRACWPAACRSRHAGHSPTTAN
jgi:hypothetical protein